MPILVNGHKAKVTKFPGGEMNVCVGEDSIYGRYASNRVDIKAYLYSSDDVMALALTVDALRRVAVGCDIHLEIPYFPYARQDRVCNKGEALSVAVMANIINGLIVQSVRVWDPHSNVLPALLDNYVHDEDVESSDAVSLLIANVDLSGFTVVCPDSGAKKRALAIANEITRNGYAVDLLAGKKFLIVDDICDGGATFKAIASDLKRRGAEQVLLYVTHGIFSKGLHVLKEHIDHVYCMHTFLRPEDRDNEFLTVLGADDAHQSIESN